MKINYISYLDPFVFNGGGEMIMNSLLSHVKKNGHQVFFTTISPKRNEYIESADLTILCDVFNAPRSFSKIDKEFLLKVISKGKYIHFDNSFVDCCNLDYLPCNGSVSSYCSFKSYTAVLENIRRRDFSNKCFQTKDIVRKIYEGSLSNIFLSPLHYKKIRNMLGFKNENYFILRPTVDTNLFYDRGEERDIEYVFAGAISEAKGVENLKEYFKGTGEKLLMIGRNIYPEKLDFAEYTGFIEYSKMPEYFNRAKNFIYLPRWPEPQGRVVVEAALCGCNLITNGNVGATSFDFDISEKKNLEGAEKEFWNYVFLLLI